MLLLLFLFLFRSCVFACVIASVFVLSIRLLDSVLQTTISVPYRPTVRPTACDSLLPKDGNHDVPVFQAVPTGRFVDLTPLKPPHRCDAVSNFFWGRAVDVQKVRNRLPRAYVHHTLYMLGNCLGAGR